jgi:hypothetical protein
MNYWLILWSGDPVKVEIRAGVLGALGIIALLKLSDDVLNEATKIPGITSLND